MNFALECGVQLYMIVSVYNLTEPFVGFSYKSDDDDIVLLLTCSNVSVLNGSGSG